MRKTCESYGGKLWASRALCTVVFFTHPGLLKKLLVIRLQSTVFALFSAHQRFAFSRVFVSFSPLSTHPLTETTN